MRPSRASRTPSASCRDTFQLSRQPREPRDRSQGQAADLVFNLCDEGYHNDAFMGCMSRPSWSSRASPTRAPGGLSALCYDKALVRALAAELDIRCPWKPMYSRATSRYPASIFPRCASPTSATAASASPKMRWSRRRASWWLSLEAARQLSGPAGAGARVPAGGRVQRRSDRKPSTGLRALPILEVDYGGLEPSLPRILGTI